MTDIVPENIRQAVNQLGDLQQRADALKELSRNNKTASNSLVQQVRAVLDRVRQLGIERNQMVEALKSEITTLLQTATQRQVEHLENLQEILASETTYEEIQQIAQQLQDALRGNDAEPPSPPSPPPPEEGIQMQEMRRLGEPRQGELPQRRIGRVSRGGAGMKSRQSKKVHKYYGGYVRSPTKGEVEISHSTRRRRKTKTRSKTRKMSIK
jgi:CRISPR/Cas system CSM-associated protein Csm2 small subunit